MEYAFLIYVEQGLHENMTPEQGAAAVAKNWEIMDEAARRGVFRGIQRLEYTSRSVTARRQDGDVVFSDGPFAETKEILGGFYLIECEDDMEARYWAGRLARTGCSTAVEFRPVAQVPPRVKVPQEEPDALLTKV